MEQMKILAAVKLNAQLVRLQKTQGLFQGNEDQLQKHEKNNYIYG